MKKPEKFDSYIVGGGYNDLLKWVCDYNNGAAHMLSKAIDWYNWKKGDWFYLSDKEFADILEKDERNVRRYKKFLKDKGVLIVKIGMLHGRKTTYYKINVCLIKELITKNRKPKSANAINKSLEKYREINGCSDDTNTDGHGARMPYDRGQECPMTGGADALCHRAEMSGSTLSYNTSNNTSSSLEAPLLESQAVPVQAEKEDYNKHYGKSEQPEESPVHPIEAYVHQVQELPPQASNANAVQPVDLKGVAERKIEIWNNLCPVAKCEAKDFIFGLNSRFVDSFNRSFDEWEEYCRKIASSKFLMGERPMHNGSFYRLSLTWALSLKNIADVKNGKYDSDRLIALTPRQLADSTQKILNTQKQEALGGIENSNLEGWVKELKRAWLEKFGVSAYWRFNNAVLVEKQDGHLNFIARTNEMEKFMADKKPDIQEMLSLTGMTHEVKLWNERTWRNRERPLLSHAPLMENSVDISGAIQSFVQNMRLPGSPGKPTLLEDLPDLSGEYAHHMQPSIRNALINATERFANRA